MKPCGLRCSWARKLPPTAHDVEASVWRKRDAVLVQVSGPRRAPEVSTLNYASNASLCMTAIVNFECEHFVAPKILIDVTQNLAKVRSGPVWSKPVKDLSNPGLVQHHGRNRRSGATCPTDTGQQSHILNSPRETYVMESFAFVLVGY